MPDAGRPDDVRARGWQRVIVTLGVIAVVILGGVGLTTIGGSDPFTQLDFVAAIAAAVSLGVSGAVLVSRLPAHPVGWLLWASSCLFALAIGGQGIAEAVAPTSPTIAAWIVLAAACGWVPGIVGVTVLLPLLFPTGRLQSPRWRVVLAAGIAAAAFDVAQNVLSPFDPTQVPPGFTNPLSGAGLAPDLGGLLGGISTASGVICIPLIAISLARRFRRSTGVERAQLKWLAAAVAVSGPALAFALVIQRLPGDLASFVSDLGYLLAFVGFALVPVAIGIAILRYRLYDIDILIRRTAVYVPLTAILAGLYAALTALLQRLFIAATGERSDAAVIASTLVLATLFTPVKGWLQGVVDRRFRDDADAGRQLERFISRIGTAEYAPDPGRTLRAFAAVAVNALDATGGRAVVASASGAPRGDAGPGWPTVLSVEVASAERVLGRIDLGPRSRQRAYRPDEQALLQVAADDLARAILVGDPGPSGTPAPDGRQAGHAKLVDETVEAPAATG